MRPKHITVFVGLFIILLSSILFFSYRSCENFQDAPETEYTGSTVPIKVFLYADKLKPTAKALLSSLKQHNFNYEVLGLGKPWEGWTGRTKEYLSAIRKYKGDNGGSALALFIDAFDVICIMDSSRFYEKYMKRERLMPVIFGAEQGCLATMCNESIIDWYDYNEIEGGKARVESQVNRWGDENENLWSKTPAFTNNGTILGTADGLEFLFSEIIKTGISDDQLAAGKVITENFDRFDIDFEEVFFRNKFRNLEKRPDEDGIDGPGFLHFHAMRTDEQQNEVLRRFENYM